MCKTRFGSQGMIVVLKQKELKKIIMALDTPLLGKSDEIFFCEPFPRCIGHTTPHHRLDFMIGNLMEHPFKKTARKP